MKKSIHQMELFPLEVAGEQFFVTYTVLKEFVENNVATIMEREIYEQVKTIFEDTREDIDALILHIA